MNAPAQTALSPAPFDRKEAERFLMDALGRALEQRTVAVVRFPAPRAPADAMLRALRRDTAIAWRPPEGPELSAHGAAATLSLRGDDRFEDLKRESAALFAELQRVTHPDAPLAAPRLFGGFSFAVGGASQLPWRGFGDGRFFLARWTYERGASPTLTYAADLRDGWAGRLSLARAELGAVWDALVSPAPETPPPSVVRVDHLSPERWRAQIDAITDAIARGEFEKVVAARRTEVRTDRDLDAWAILRGLGARYPETWRFGLRFGQSTFLAATPERLFVKRGRLVETDALAGSIAANGEDAEARLLASAKDQREHRPVVEHLQARLGPLCTQLDAPDAPQLRRMPNILHLHTQLRGHLRAEVHAADLASALHPTPAVGGVPAEAAVQWIAAQEAHPRGWYAGPVGWLDADGDADFAVALRCGVIQGANAWAWAGGGIVEGSEPDAEWQESALKLRPFTHALGVEEQQVEEQHVDDDAGRPK
ncbi:MAG: isochorismate synthase [Sandaracinaceae bacterium]